jgi:hypothetical protein
VQSISICTIFFELNFIIFIKQKIQSFAQFIQFHKVLCRFGALNTGIFDLTTTTTISSIEKKSSFHLRTEFKKWCEQQLVLDQKEIENDQKSSEKAIDR